MNKEVKSVSTPAPIIYFRSARKRSYLIRAKLYPLERTVGSLQYGGKRCQICNNVKEAEIFTCTTTDKTFETNHKLNYNQGQQNPHFFFVAKRKKGKKGKKKGFQGIKHLKAFFSKNKNI